ncbi:MAG TPA: NUDIX hydrolase [Gemmatimonadales bacterium]|nr:NUDIX hydrolase [Gemmatimonadales bacterium]
MPQATRRVYTGRVLNLDVDTVQFPDGSSGELEIIRHPGAAAVVPVLSDPNSTDPVLLLLRQFRYAAGGPLWEIPAGRLDHGEAPEACARRELREEAGVEAGRLERLTTIWTTPGFTDEAIHLFWAADLKSVAHAREPDEFIEVVPKPMTEVLSLIRDGEIRDGKTVVAILYMAGFVFGLE